MDREKDELVVKRGGEDQSRQSGVKKSLTKEPGAIENYEKFDTVQNSAPWQEAHMGPRGEAFKRKRKRH